MAKYGEIPVNYYTGVPDISIPIWTLKEGSIAVDVSLSYHGSGIKVDEEASWVGLGWSLNAGGMITRTVKGRAEYFLEGGLLQPERSNIDFYSQAHYSSLADYIDQNDLDAAATGQLDNEPDEYFYNFNGRSGQFHFDRNGKALLEKQEGIEISVEYVSLRLYNFIIKTEDGVRYTFSNYEMANYGYDEGNIISSWYLTNIKAPDGHEVSFEYQALPTIYEYVRKYSEYVVDAQYPYIYAGNDPIQGTSSSEIVIKRITTSDGRIDFTQGNTERKDYMQYANHYPLDKISVYNTDGKLLKAFKLYTGFFEANNGEKYINNGMGDLSFLNFRLRLDSVQEIAQDSITQLPPYKFTYLGDNNPATDDPYTLPYRLAPFQDHWGYFNDIHNTTILPSNARHLSINNDEGYLMYTTSVSDFDCGSVNIGLINGGSREPNANAMLAGSLSDIYYPTGGTSHFIFEPNRDGYEIVEPFVGGLRIQKITNQSNQGGVTETKYEYGGFPYTDPEYGYYKKYCVYYKSDGTPNFSPEFLALFGLPGDNNGGQGKTFIKISATPQAVLGSRSEVGYSSVTVSQTGNGYASYLYDDATLFQDYTNTEYFNETMDLEHIFTLQDITDTPSPGFPNGLAFDRVISTFDWPYPDKYSNSWKRGVLADKYIYSEDSVLVRHEKYEYDRQLMAILPAFKVIRVSLGSEYAITRSYVPHGWMQLKTSTVIDYGQNLQIPDTTITTFEYDNKTHAQLSRKTVSRSDGKEEGIAMTYPPDYAEGTPFIDDMNAKHLTGLPIEQVKYIKDENGFKIIGGHVTTYQPGGNGLKAEEFNLDITAPLLSTGFKFSNRAPSIFPPSGTSSTFFLDAHYLTYLKYDIYGEKGSLRQYTQNKSEIKALIWDDTYQHINAVVNNARQIDIAYTSFEGAQNGNWIITNATVADQTSPSGNKCYLLGQLIKDSLNANKTYTISYWSKNGVYTVTGSTTYKTGKTINGWTYYEHKVSGITSIKVSGTGFIDEVRLYPEDAQMTTYLYDPLIGITDIFDNRSMVTHYEYDNFGRIHLVRDQEGMILKQIDYQYQRPVTQ